MERERLHGSTVHTMRENGLRTECMGWVSYPILIMKFMRVSLLMIRPTVMVNILMSKERDMRAILLMINLMVKENKNLSMGLYMRVNLKMEPNMAMGFIHGLMILIIKDFGRITILTVRVSISGLMVENILVGGNRTR